MATNFPSSLDNSTTLPAEGAAVPLSTNHVTAHQNIQDALEAIEAKVGVDSSAVTTSHDYKLSEVTSTDKAVGKTATQTLTNKTLTSPTITGATITTSSVNGVTIQTAGSATDFLAANGTYQTGAVANASTTVKGIVELATAAEISAGTATGGTGAALVVSADTITFSEFGYGQDGALTYDGSTTVLGMAPSSSIYTLTRDIYGTTITINNGVTIETAGYRIFAKTSLTNNGTIKRTPNAGGNASGITGGTAGSALANGTLYGSLAGKAGAAGTSYGAIGSGNIGTNGTAGDNQTSSVGVAGVAGGAGGSGGGSSGSPGSGGGAGTNTASLQSVNNIVFATSMFDFANSTLIKSSSGSGSGGSGSATSSGSAGTTGAGGGSGSAGGIVFISARVLTNSGTISALGGAGGSGSAGTDGSGNGGGGGGGGGAGGVVVLIYKSITLGTVTVTGGAGGTGGAGNGSGSNGSNGTTGTTGAIIQIAC